MTLQSHEAPRQFTRPVRTKLKETSADPPSHTPMTPLEPHRPRNCHEVATPTPFCEMNLTWLLRPGTALREDEDRGITHERRAIGVEKSFEVLAQRWPHFHYVST